MLDAVQLKTIKITRYCLLIKCLLIHSTQKQRWLCVRAFAPRSGGQGFDY